MDYQYKEQYSQVDNHQLILTFYLKLLTNYTQLWNYNKNKYANLNGK